jgi:hypothetical protein
MVGGIFFIAIAEAKHFCLKKQWFVWAGIPFNIDFGVFC